MQNPSKPERDMAALLEQWGVPYLMHYPLVPGLREVDFYLPGCHSVLEVGGCVFHGCYFCPIKWGWQRYESDERKMQALEERGVMAVRIWEHRIYWSFHHLGDVTAFKKRPN